MPVYSRQYRQGRTIKKNKGSENNNGIKEAIIIKVVLITALKVLLSQYVNASSGVKPLLLLKLYDDIICIESSTINPKTIAKINAFDKLK